MSKTNAKAAAAASVQAIVRTGRGIMAIPPTANIEAIRISAADAAASHGLGREPHMCRR